MKIRYVLGLLCSQIFVQNGYVKGLLLMCWYSNVNINYVLKEVKKSQSDISLYMNTLNIY